MDTFDYEAGNPFVDDELYDVDLTFSGQDQNAVTDGSLHSFTVLENHSSFSAEPVDRNDSKGANKNGKAQNRVSARDMDDIALHLLQGHFYLTALELHTEIVERGRELPRLREYFSNPANFEKSAAVANVVRSPADATQTNRPHFNSMGDYLGDKLAGSNLSRAGSVSTFDSLDWSHISEDNEPGNDRIAVLEFQLRKADETIAQLRKSLTSSTRSRGIMDNKLSDVTLPRSQSPDSTNRDTVTRPSRARDASGLDGVDTGSSSFEPYESAPCSAFSDLDSKALNFIVYEYLQKTGCKLTAISLADERQDQDFEDWDDVGLNTAKPPSLEDIYLKFLNFSKIKTRFCDAEVQCEKTDTHQNDPLLLSQPNKKSHDADSLFPSETDVIISDSVEHIISDNHSNCSDTNSAKETAQKSEHSPVILVSTDDVKLNPSESNSDESHRANISALEKQIEELKRELSKLEDNNQQLSRKNTNLETEVFELQTSLQSQSMQFRGVPDGSDDASDGTEKKINAAVEDVSEEGKSQTASMHSFGAISVDKTLPIGKDGILGHQYTMIVKNSLATASSVVNLDHEHQTILDNVQKGGDLPHIAEKCLPNLVANILLQHRIEALPFIIQTITVHPEQEARIKLLELLFNLIKKPDIRQRHVISQSCVIYARRAGCARVEAEVLPLCWGQMNEKHVERRILVAETATALLPYMDVDIASSLVYSILTQLLEDKEDVVVAAAIKGLSFLLCFLNSAEKFDSYLKTIISYIKSNNETEQLATKQLLIPTFAYWTMKQRDSLLQNAVFIVVQHIDNLLKVAPSSVSAANIEGSNESSASTTSATSPQLQTQFSSSFICYCACLEAFLPFLFVDILRHSPFASKNPEREELLPQATEASIFSRFPQATIAAQDVRSMVEDSSHMAWMIHTFDEYLKETTHPEWDQLRWVIDMMLPKFVHILVSLDVNAVPCVNSMSTVCYTLCRVFGKPFTLSKFASILRAELVVDENSDQDHTRILAVLNGSLVPVLAAGVLTTVCDEKANMADIGTFLTEMISLYSVHRAPLLSLRAAMIALLSNSYYHPVIVESLYSAVINSSTQVKLTACQLLELAIRIVNEMLLTQRVIPAIITLSGDTDLKVRSASACCLGSVLMIPTAQEVHDKILMQLDTLMDEQALHFDALRIFGRILGSVNERIRNDFILSRVKLIARGNNACESDTTKQKCALLLFEFYSAACNMNVLYSPDVISNQILPGLRSLKQDLTSLGADKPQSALADQLNSTLHMIRDMEVQAGVIPAPGGGGVSTGGGQISGFLNSSGIKNSSSGAKIETNLFSKLKGLAK